MTAKNYTSIDDLIKKWKQSSIGLPKEVEPVSIPTESLQMQESSEHQVSPEVKPYVQQRHETIKLPPDLTMLGLQPTTASQFSSYKNVKLPISDEKVIKGLHDPINSSSRWLSEFAIFILRQAHLTLRIVGGKVI